MASKKSLEKLGWVFLGGREPYEEDLGDGVFRRFPGHFAAEKHVSDGHVREDAESLDRLVEVISLYEARLDGLKEPEAAASEVEVEGVAA